MRATPDALALFNPAVVLAPIAGGEGEALPELDRDRALQLRKRLGTDPATLSPYHHVREDLPATIIFHGRSDEVVPHDTVALFEQALAKAGNQVELVSYDGEGHGFFNHGRGDGSAYEDTLRRLDEFLIELGWLK